jgi:hypothetical protein
LEGLVFEVGGIFYGHFGMLYSHLAYFIAICYILWLFALYLLYLSSFGILYQEKSGNTE